MDSLTSSIPWPAVPVIFGLAVAGVVLGLQKLKMLAWSSKRWTKRIPKWVWLTLSIVLPFGLVIFLSQPWVFGWLNHILPSGMQVDLSPQDMLGIGVSAVFGGQGAYPLAKKYGLIGDYSDVEHGHDIAYPEPASETQSPQPQSEPVPQPEPVVSPAPVVQQRPGWPTAHLLQDVTPTNGKSYWIALDPPEGAVYPLKGGES